MADHGDLDRATARLDRALSMLEARLQARKARPILPVPPGEDDLFGRLDASDREKELEAAAEEAAAALGRAAEEMRAVLKGAA
jgi:hypothetical protein